ncbi:MAG TPA: trehalose-phosphatase [Acidimicrobiia bacterium]|nr:trehalose-phosphatase [Acidimicrobiia bacterium]
MRVAESADDLVARLAPFAQQPARSVVVLDFDGSLAPIVDDPPSAAPLPGAVAVLGRLVRRAGRVAVVSGRPVEFLRAMVPVDGLMLFGQYGVERLDGTTVVTDPRARSWSKAVEAAAAEAGAALPGLFVEHKGAVAVALHWRRAPHLGAAALDLGHRLATTHGLRLERGRLALELRAPVDVDKGTTTAALAAGAHAALVAGDDRGDLAAFAALARLVDEGRVAHALRVAVRSPESPGELLRRADHTVDGPAGLVALLGAVADVLDPGSR